MTNSKIILLIVLALLFLACDADNNPSEEINVENFVFEDGFETQNKTIDELFLSNGSRWTGIQQVNPSTNSTNQISIGIKAHRL